MFFLLEVFFSPFSPRGASMPTRVGDGHWWFFELFRLLLLSHYDDPRAVFFESAPGHESQRFSRNGGLGK